MYFVNIKASYTGGGVYLDQASFEMTGGSITGNKATYYGGGVYVTGTGVTFKLSGSPVIEDNTINTTHITLANDIYLTTGKTISVTGALTEGASIGITLEDTTGSFASGFDAAYGDPANFFKPDLGTDYIAEAGENGAVSLVHKYYTVIYVDLQGNESQQTYNFGEQVALNDATPSDAEDGMKYGWTTVKGGSSIMYDANATIEGGLGTEHGQVIYLYAVAERDVADDVDTIKDELQAAIEAVNSALSGEGGTVDTATLAAALDALIDAYEKADQELANADSALKTELETAIESAEATLINSIKVVQTNLDNAVNELKGTISTNTGNIADLKEALAELKAAYEAADAVMESDIAELKEQDTAFSESLTALDTAYKAADSALQASVDSVQANLDKAVEELNASIAAGSADVADKLAELKAAYEAADAVMESDIAELKAQDTAFSESLAELDTAYKAADTALQEAIAGVEDKLESEVDRLEGLINSGTVDVTELKEAIAALETSYKAADTLIRNDFAAADSALSASIASLNAAYKKADDALEAAIEAVQSNLDKAVEELNASIAANAEDTAAKLAALEEAYKAADTLIRSDFAEADSALAESIAALDTSYKAADEAIWEAVEQLQNDVGNLNGRVDGLQSTDTVIIATFASVMGVIAIGCAIGFVFAFRKRKM